MTAPPGPVCDATSCTELPTTQWQRRTSTAEWDALVSVWEQQATGKGYPADTFVPRDGVALVSVFACDTHKIDAHAASGLHEASCTAPPTCNCIPEFPPPADPPLTPPAAPAATTPTS